MTHFDRDTFLIYPDAELPDLPSPVNFAIGPDGRATSMTIDNLNSNGLGVLARSGKKCSGDSHFGLPFRFSSVTTFATASHCLVVVSALLSSKHRSNRYHVRRQGF